MLELVQNVHSHYLLSFLLKEKQVPKVAFTPKPVFRSSLIKELSE